MDDADVAIAAVTVVELLVGVKLASGKRRASRRAFVDDIVSSLPIIGYDASIAVEYPSPSARGVALLCAVLRVRIPALSSPDCEYPYISIQTAEEVLASSSSSLRIGARTRSTAASEFPS